jgi:tetratricopeptide (TPR) repeat protein
LLYVAGQVNRTRVKFLLCIRTPDPESPLDRSPFIADAEKAQILVKTLAKLTSEDSRRLVIDLARSRGRNVSSGSIKMILHRADGLPLLLRELTTQMIDPRSSKKDRTPKLVIASDPLLNYVRGRFGDLDVLTVRLAEIMSVHGGRMRVSDWGTIAQMSESQAMQSCWSIVRAGVGEYDSDAGVGIKHDVIRDVLYASIPSDYRKMLHAVVARFAGENQLPFGIAAFHYERAGRLDLAFEYALRAAAESVSRYAYLEAAEWYKFAANSSRGPSASDRLRVRAAICSIRGGALKKARAELLALQATSESLTSSLFARIAVEYACVDARISDATAEDRLDRFRALVHHPKVASNPQLRCKVFQAWMLFAAEMGAPSDAPPLDDFLATIELLGGTSGAVTARLDLAKALCFLDSTSAALPILAKAKPAAERLDDPTFWLWTLSATAAVQMLSGDLHAANRYFEAYRVAAERTGLESAVLSYWNNRGFLFMEMGDFDSARSYLRKALLVSRRAGTMSLFATAVDNLHVLYFESGEHEMIRSLDAELTIAKQSTYYPYTAEAIRGLLMLEGGRLRDARLLAVMLKEQMHSSPPTGDRGYLEIFLCRTAIRMDPTYDPTSRLRRLAEEMAPKNMIDSNRIALEMARHLRKRDPHEARTVLEKVVASCSAGGARILALEADAILVRTASAPIRRQ